MLGDGEKGCTNSWTSSQLSEDSNIARSRGSRCGQWLRLFRKGVLWLSRHYFYGHRREQTWKISHRPSPDGLFDACHHELKTSYALWFDARIHRGRAALCRSFSPRQSDVTRNTVKDRGVCTLTLLRICTLTDYLDAIAHTSCAVLRMGRNVF